MSTWLRRSASPMNQSCCVRMSTISFWLRAASLPALTALSSSTTWLMLKGATPSIILSFSIFVISRIPLSRSSRYSDDACTLFRQSMRRSSLCSGFKAISVMPMMPFMGVRISWDMRARKSDFACADWSRSSWLMRFWMMVPTSRKVFAAASSKSWPTSVRKNTDPEYLPAFIMGNATPQQQARTSSHMAKMGISPTGCSRPCSPNRCSVSMASRESGNTAPSSMPGIGSKK